MVNSRTRLSRKPSRLGNDRLKRQIVSELKVLPTERLKKYATLSDKAVLGSPVLSLTKSEARAELARRAETLQSWKTGVRGAKEPLAPKIVKGAKKFAELAGKGFQEYMKVISGAKAQELEEAIASIGLKGKEKEAYLKKHRKELAEAEEPFEPYPAEPDVPDFRLADVVKEGHRELQRAKKEAYL